MCAPAPPQAACPPQKAAGPASVASVPHRPCVPRQGRAQLGCVSVRVPHAPYAQDGGGIFVSEGGSLVTEGSTISNCNAVVRQHRCRRRRWPRECRNCATQAPFTA